MFITSISLLRGRYAYLFSKTTTGSGKKEEEGFCEAI